jgi:LmbE family N-acetylglucosaminyl deacetylase
MLKNDVIFILAPHTDDGELGCGATISKYKEAGKIVFYIAFSTCEQSLPSHLPADTLRKECIEATTTLGITSKEVLFMDFTVRHFQENRQEILECLVELNKKHKPDTVFLPAKNDVHQDHQVIHNEGSRAFKNCNLIGYELPWNNKNFQPNYFEVLGEANITTKVKALQQYQSQHHRNYMNEEFIRALALVRGVQSNTRHAEAFEIYNLIL